MGADIPSTQLRALQENVIAAVQTNVGPFLPDEVDIWSVEQTSVPMLKLANLFCFQPLVQSAVLQVVRAAMVCRINCLAQGNSAISLDRVDDLVVSLGLLLRMEQIVLC